MSHVLLCKLSFFLNGLIYKPSLRAITFGAPDVFGTYFGSYFGSYFGKYFPNVIQKSEFCL